MTRTHTFWLGALYGYLLAQFARFIVAMEWWPL